MKSTDSGNPDNKTKFFYAIPAFALAVAGIPIYIYIPKFYTDTIGVSMVLVGNAVLILRITDAITDPAMGLISDRMSTPFGRRRPFILLGSILLATSILFLFNPGNINPSQAFWWFLGWLAAVFLFWTITSVPYESLGPELCRDYHERTRLFALRDGFLIFGTMVAAATPILIRPILSAWGRLTDDQTVFSVMSLIYAFLIVICCLLCVFFVKEPNIETTPDRAKSSYNFKIILQNKPFLILLTSFSLSSIAAQLPAALILFYVQYVLNSGGAEIFLLIYFVSGILFLPLWVHVSGKIGKKIAWIISMGINTSAFLIVFWLGPGDEIYYGILVFLSGIGFGAGLALPSSITADVIDYDEMLSGERREGQYIGIFSIAKKMSAALGAGTGLWILGLSGYTPNTDQNSDVIFALRVLYALLPSLLNIIALLVACVYPLSESRHKEILKEIDRRRTSE